MGKTKEKKENQIEGFDLQFKNIIKNIINEERYFKEENIKILVHDILKEIDPLIAKHVKKHLKEIASFILEMDDSSKEEKNAQTS